MDPIFAAIDAHKQAMKNFEAAVRRTPDDDAPADVVKQVKTEIVARKHSAFCEHCIK